jgi:hypothetical protein
VVVTIRKEQASIDLYEIVVYFFGSFGSANINGNKRIPILYQVGIGIATADKMNRHTIVYCVTLVIVFVACPIKPNAINVKNIDNNKPDGENTKISL